MTKYTQKQLRNMVRDGIAIDATHFSDWQDIKEPYKQIGYASGVYGCNGKLLYGMETGNLYAIISRTAAIFIF